MKTKFLFSLIILIMFPALASCGGTTSNGQSQTADDESYGILKAFGLKGKVKSITFVVDAELNTDGYPDTYTYYFDSDGTVLNKPESKDGNVSMCDMFTPHDELCFYVEDWQIKVLSRGGMGPRIEYRVTGYDELNRPNLADAYYNEELAKRNVRISYDGRDSNANYSKIIFDTKNIENENYFIHDLTVKIDYWPDDADMPKKLTETDAIEIIKKANIKDSSALTEEFKTVLDMYDELPRIIGDNGDYYFESGIGRTILSYEEATVVPDIKVAVKGLDVYAPECAQVRFNYTLIYDDGTYCKEDLESSLDYQALAEFRYIDGKWVISNVGLDVYMQDGIELADHWVLDNRELEIESQIEDIRSGVFIKRVKECFTADPDLNKYIKTVEDFQKKYLK